MLRCDLIFPATGIKSPAYRDTLSARDRERKRERGEGRVREATNFTLYAVFPLCDADIWRHRTSTFLSFLVFYTPLRVVKKSSRPSWSRWPTPGPIFICVFDPVSILAAPSATRFGQYLNRNARHSKSYVQTRLSLSLSLSVFDGR